MSHKDHTNRFEEHLKKMSDSGDGSSRVWRDSLIVVADTAYMCKLWLDEYSPDFTTADLLEMTRMVVDRETSTIRLGMDISKMEREDVG